MVKAEACFGATWWWRVSQSKYVYVDVDVYVDVGINNRDPNRNHDVFSIEHMDITGYSNSFSLTAGTSWGHNGISNYIESTKCYLGLSENQFSI